MSYVMSTMMHTTMPVPGPVLGVVHLLWRGAGLGSVAVSVMRSTTRVPQEAHHLSCRCGFAKADLGLGAEHALSGRRPRLAPHGAHFVRRRPRRCQRHQTVLLAVGPIEVPLDRGAEK